MTASEDEDEGGDGGAIDGADDDVRHDTCFRRLPGLCDGFCRREQGGYERRHDRFLRLDRGLELAV